ncbi:MAG: hypothetical protein WDA27_08825 [Actinomycetota bacterium]
MRKFIAAAMLLVAVFAVSPPAHAQQAIAFTGVATLDPFPCPEGNCSGTFLGSATGTISGTMTADFTYWEAADCSLGTAAGTLSIGSHDGTFFWSRVGTTAIISAEIDGDHYDAEAAFVPDNVDGCVPGGTAKKVVAQVAGTGAGA